jgi:hypothetical protein
VSIWLEVARSIHQERLAEAERDRVLRQCAVARDSVCPSRWPVQAWLRRWLPGWVRRSRVSRPRINDGASAASPAGVTETRVKGESVTCTQVTASKT